MPNPHGRTVRDREITESPTLRAFLEDWLQSIVHSVRPRTWARYSEYVHLHVVPTLGNRTLEGLTPKDIQTLYSQKIRQGLSPRSVLHLHRVIHRALAHAHRWGLVDANQADLVEPPRPEQREMKALSPVWRKNSSAVIWVSWYKKSSGKATDLTEDVVRNYALANGLVDIKVCAVSEEWSGLKLVVPVAKR